MSRLPALDAHAHVDPTISQTELRRLTGVIFAMTRSLSEAEVALGRTDDNVVWGVGCHPGVGSAQACFTAEDFQRLIARSALVGEVGLDGTSVVPIDDQRGTLRQSLGALQCSPRLISLHSYRAHRQVIEELERTPVKGVILHWWLGSAELTRRALDLGCYFSVNAAMAARRSALDGLPLDRLLTETDHPYGDRRGPAPHLPGGVEPIEAALARRQGIAVTELRATVWRNLRTVVSEAGVTELLPRRIRSHLVLV